MAGNGSAELAALAARLKAAGARDLRLQLLRGLKEGAKPLVDQARERARETFPKSGGLAEREADQKILVSVRTGARTAGVRVIARKLSGYQADKYGYVRHPVFNRRAKDGKRVWAKDNQLIPAAEGWFTDVGAKGAPTVTPELLKVLEEVSIAINGRI
jgi:hypothetical protein